METKHTKGEWRANGMEIRHKNNGLILATVYEHLPINQKREEAEANARLIAAAPELLEALQVLLKSHYKLSFELNGDANATLEEMMAESAINKATK